MSCPLGYDPETDCSLGDVCHPATDGAGCPLACPCEMSQQECPPMPAPKGMEPGPCPEPPLCLPRMQPSGNPYVEGPSFAYGGFHRHHEGSCAVPCPEHCEARGMQTCPVDYDQMGCPLPEVCAGFDEECPQPKRDSMGCEIFNEFVECATNEYECYGVEDELGCVGPSTCVPEDAECPTSQFSGGCPVYDPKDYECDWETEIACPGGMDPKGCLLPDICLPFDPEDQCGPARCPAEECGPDSMSCPEPKNLGMDMASMYGPKDTEEQCPMPNSCHPATDYDGCPMFCMPDYDWYNDMVCQDMNPTTGCLDAPYVMPAKDPNGCPAQCPVTCGPGEMLCSEAPRDLGDGECPYTYDHCMPELDHAGCPAFCPADFEFDYENEILCDRVMDGQSCYMMPFTLPAKDPSGCPAFCPVNCGPEEIYCEGPSEVDGCPSQGQCMPAKDMYSGCETFCYPNYDYETEMVCQDYNRETGCLEAPVVLPAQDGSSCPAFCPVNCGPEEIYCEGPSNVDGCPGEGQCMPAKDMYSGCETFCYPNYDYKTEMVCQDYNRETGCLEAPLILPTQDGNDCPTNCPVTCGPEEMLCPGEVDPYSQCPMPDMCYPSADPSGCPTFCPVVCGQDEIYCGDVAGPDGCMAPGQCLPADQANLCQSK